MAASYTGTSALLPGLTLGPARMLAAYCNADRSFLWRQRSPLLVLMAMAANCEVEDDDRTDEMIWSERPVIARSQSFRRRIRAAVDKRKSTPLSSIAAASHWPTAVHVIQDGDRELRCIRLTGDTYDVTTTRSGDLWRELSDVQRCDIEDASDELMTSLTRHTTQLTSMESLSVSWTPMKVVPGSWTRSLFPHLVSLSLTRNQLRSVDAIESASCSRLEKLDLSNNLLETLPKHFGRAMPRLTALVVTGNGLRLLPDSVGRMLELRSLECAGNKLTKLPASVADLSQLRILDVSGNSLVSLPDNIGRLSNLEDLRASGNRLSAVPSSFAHLSRLRSLLISHNHFVHVPMELSALPSLELLNASNNAIAAVDCVLPGVRRLLLDDNRLTAIPRGILQCRRLEVLSVERNLIREVPEDIRQLDALTTLSLAGNGGVAAVPSAVGELVRLRRLTLRSTRVRSLPSALGDLRRRTIIDLVAEAATSSGDQLIAPTEYVAD